MKDNAVFVTRPFPVSFVGGIGDDADASASMSDLDHSSSSKDLAITAAHRGDISEKGPAYEIQFLANNMMSGGDMSHKISAQELQFPANYMMSGVEGI